MPILALVLFATYAALSAVPAPEEEFCIECCSLYCAVLPRVTTSAGEGRAIADGDTKSEWSVTHDGTEQFEFLFSAVRDDVPLKPTMGVDTLSILSGGGEDQATARPRDVELLVDGQSRAKIRLLDTAKAQKIVLPRIPLHEGLRVTFRIVTVFNAMAGAQVVIREVRIDGYGHH